MRKRISCKVIRTIPLGNNIDELRYTSRSKDKSHNNNNATRISKTSEWASEMSVNPQAEHSRKTVIYTDRLKKSRIPIDNGLTAPIINCYA